MKKKMVAEDFWLSDVPCDPCNYSQHDLAIVSLSASTYPWGPKTQGSCLDLAANPVRVFSLKNKAG